MFANETRKIILTVAALMTAIAFTACSKNQSSKVVIKGSTTVLPIAQKAIEAYAKVDPSVKISLSGTGSGDGIKSIIEGSCDIANASRGMKDKEVKKAEDLGKAIKGVTVAYDMIVPVVHPSNGIKKITTDQLKAIYKGEIKNWKELGGKDMDIVVISRDTSSGTYEVWESKVMSKENVMQGALLQASNGAVVSAVAGNPKAIGYIGFGYISDSVKPLDVNGIVPTLENGKSGKYPVSRKLFMFINENEISKEAKAFIDYVVSEEGQKLVKDAGFISL